MSNYFIWLILSQVTGSPVASGIAMLLFYWAVDRYTLGVLPDPFRFIDRLRRQWRLERHLEIAQHDRKARSDLGELYLWRRQYAKAVDVLRPNLEAGDDNIESVFNMGVACLGAGHSTQGEKLLAHALEMQPGFRNGEIHLELGRFRVQRGDFAAAREPLEKLIEIRKGTVEGRVLLARALVGLKDDGAAALLKDQAWAEHAAAPRFQRRRQRLWAWRARPSRPAMYAAVLVLMVTVIVKVVLPALPQRASAGGYGAYGGSYDPTDDDFDGASNAGGPKVAVLSYKVPALCTELHDVSEAMVERLERSTQRQPSLEISRAACPTEGAVALCDIPQPVMRVVWYTETPSAAQMCRLRHGTLTPVKGP